VKFSPPKRLKTREPQGLDAFQTGTEAGRPLLVHPHPVAKLHRARLAAVLAADAYFQIRVGRVAQLHRHLDRLAHALLVNHAKRAGFAQNRCRNLSETLASVTTEERSQSSVSIHHRETSLQLTQLKEPGE